MIFQRQIKYYYLRFIRLKGSPHELALGMALGIFCGMMPIMPFQVALAVTLAIFFKGSKLAAAIGTWVSNPLNWYFIYYWNYKLGVMIFSIPEKNALFSSIVAAVQSGEDFMVIFRRIMEAGGIFTATILFGGITMGIIAALPAYFILVPVFKRIKAWRALRRSKKHQ